MDLPALRDEHQGQSLVYVAISAKPWAGQYSLYSSPDQNGFALRKSHDRMSNIGTLRTTIEAGSVGRLDRKNTIQIDGIGAGIESVGNLALLNGANVVAIECVDGFEIIQFANAGLQPDGSWILSRLLRGQLGTEDEMRSGALMGGRVILLDQTILALPIEDREQGIALNWKIGPSRYASNHVAFTSTSHKAASRTRKMLSPVHLRADEIASTSLTQFSWVRRGRINADTWEVSEIPLDAREERYRVRVISSSATIVREETVNEPGFQYLQTARIEDLGSLTAPYTLEVGQLNDTGDAGSIASLALNF
jgi:hypothetical protein